MKRVSQSRSIWVVQRLVDGMWKNQRTLYDMPLMVDSEYKAEQRIRALDGRFTYRAIKVQD